MTETRRTDEMWRLIRAPAAAIYRALLDRDARLTWLPPEGMTARIETFDARVGGGYRMVLTYRDAGHAAGKSSPDSDVVEARFTELLPDERVVEAVRFETDDPSLAKVMTMTWSLQPVGDGTNVRVTAVNVPERISERDHEAGMASSLANLARFVE